jgi:hypothetical protein
MDVLALAIAVIRSAQESGFSNMPYLRGQLHALDAVATMYGKGSLLGDVSYLLPDLEKLEAKSEKDRVGV